MLEDFIKSQKQTIQEETVPKHIKYVDPKNQKQIDAFYEREILIMRHLQEVRHGQSPFRHTIFN